VFLATLSLEGRNIGVGPSAKYGWGEVWYVYQSMLFFFYFFQLGMSMNISMNNIEI